MFFKTIIQGRLDFSNEKSFEKVLKMYKYRTESYYKNDVLLHEDEIFNREEISLNIPRYVGQASEKCWRNTVSLLNYCSQFAVSGSLKAWMTENGKILNYNEIEPESDKAAVIQFKKGKKFAEEDGKESEALTALSKAIESHNRHANAYAKRAMVLIQLKNYDEALEDYTKAIKLDDSIPEAYYGRAIIHLRNKDLEKAIEDLQLTIKKSIALQPIYWSARLKKAECHVKRQEWKDASFDLKFFTKRSFTPDNPNYKKKGYAYFLYAQVLSEMEEFKEAFEALNQATQLPLEYKPIDQEELQYYNAFLKMKLGKKGYKKELKQSADAGFVKATQLLAGIK